MALQLLDSSSYWHQPVSPVARDDGTCTGGPQLPQLWIRAVANQNTWVLCLLPLGGKWGNGKTVLSLQSAAFLCPPGLSVNGHLMGAPFRPGHEERPRTYFDAITIAVEHPRVGYVVNVTRKGVTLHGEGELVLPFAQRAAIHKPQLAISVWPEANVTVWIGHEVEFLVLLHRYSHPTALQRDHLGFYVVNSKGLSASAGGLLGEQHLLQMQLLGC